MANLHMHKLETKQDYWMTQKEYQLVTQKTPIPTADLLILRKTKKLQVLLLVRKTGYEKGKWCLIGGRQWKNENLGETINRQAKQLGVKVKILRPFSPNFPCWIDDKPSQDMTKHSCTHIYPVKIVSGNPRKEGEEFSGIKWFDPNSLPKMAYDQRNEILNSIKQLKKFKVV